MSASIESLVNKEYQYGFVTDVESDAIPKGLSEETVRLISARKATRHEAAQYLQQEAGNQQVRSQENPGEESPGEGR